MTLSAQEKADLARWRMDKADGLLRDAQTLLTARSRASSANRSYYAALSSARALLVLRGNDPDSHEGVKIVLARDTSWTPSTCWWRRNCTKRKSAIPEARGRNSR